MKRRPTKKMGPKAKPTSGRDPHAGGNDSGSPAEMWKKKQLQMLSKPGKKKPAAMTKKPKGKDPIAESRTAGKTLKNIGKDFKGAYGGK